MEYTALSIGCKARLALLTTLGVTALHGATWVHRTTDATRNKQS
jgi:hypothetical protein